MIHLKNYNLKNSNTFQIDCIAENYYQIEHISELNQSDIFNNNFFKYATIISGGSNILLKSNKLNNVISFTNSDIIIEDGSNEKSILLRVGAGKNWNDFVRYCVDNQFFGLENLALIPGNVGAAPIQNIGAYGCEQESCFEYLLAYEIETNKVIKLKGDECNFSYRNSIFKESKGKYIISEVVYRLSKLPFFNLKYEELKKYIYTKYNKSFQLIDVYNAVCDIRKSKLPDPTLLGNSGSFFKNPIISKVQFNQLNIEYPLLKSYNYDDKSVKISAAFLIELLGYKGKKYKNTDAGVYEKHALILVNHGYATGQDVFDLSQEIIDKIFRKFNIILEREVNIL